MTPTRREGRCLSEVQRRATCVSGATPTGFGLKSKMKAAYFVVASSLQGGAAAS